MWKCEHISPQIRCIVIEKSRANVRCESCNLPQKKHCWGGISWGLTQLLILAIHTAEPHLWIMHFIKLFHNIPVLILPSIEEHFIKCFKYIGFINLILTIIKCQCTVSPPMCFDAKPSHCHVYCNDYWSLRQTIVSNHQQV